MSFNRIHVTSPHQAMVTTTPSACTPICAPMDCCTLNPVPPSATAANTPVSTVPTTPPTPCTGDTSSESSRCSTRFRNCVAKKHTTPATRPIASAPPTPTKPDAGVMVPSPATMPVITPSRLGLPYLPHSITIQASAPADAPTCVTSTAVAALPLAARALPPLKPNQPTHSM